MKASGLFGFIVSSALLFCSCQSREEKALETIREHLFNTLDDFKSYEPISTKIDSLYDIYGDTAVVKVIFKMRLMDDLINDFEKKYTEAKKFFKIWDDPRMYNYSSFAFNKRQKAYEDMQIAAIGIEATENVRNELLDTLLLIEKDHTGELYGWRVCHRFRSNTNGTSSIRNQVYFMDKKCETILYQLNEDELSWRYYVEYIDRAYKEAHERADTISISIH